MAKYYILHNEGETIKKIDSRIIEAYELRLERGIAKFLDDTGKIIALYPVKEFRIVKQGITL